MRAVIPAILLLASLPPPAQGAIAWIGAGVSSCADFGQDFKSAPNEMGSLYFTWAQGFMSGLNTRHLGTLDATDLNSKSFSLSSQQHFIERYCDQHPLADFVDAVMALVVEMRRLQGLPPEKPP